MEDPPSACIPWHQMESYTSDADNVTTNGTFSADESSISTPLHENMHVPVSTNTDNEERTTNVINPNVETIIPKNQGRARAAAVDRRYHIDQYIIERALSFDLQERVTGGFRATSPLLSINLHKYEETNSTCPETKEHCSICLEEYSDQEVLVRIDCGHIYHIDCLREWNMIMNNCPICKRKVAVLCHFPLRICQFLGRIGGNYSA